MAAGLLQPGVLRGGCAPQSPGAPRTPLMWGLLPVRAPQVPCQQRVPCPRGHYQRAWAHVLLPPQPLPTSPPAPRARPRRHHTPSLGT